MSGRFSCRLVTVLCHFTGCTRKIVSCCKSPLRPSGMKNTRKLDSFMYLNLALIFGKGHWRFFRHEETRMCPHWPAQGGQSQEPLMVTKASDFWWHQCSSSWRLGSVPILVIQHKQSLEKTGKRFGGGRRCENEPWPLPVLSPFQRLVLALITSIGQTQLCRAQSQLLLNAAGLCFWKGAWSLLRVLKVHCVAHGGKGWLSACWYPVISAVLDGCH